MPSIEITNGETNSLACDNAYHAFPSFIFLTDPGAVLLAPSCRCHSLGRPVWRQWWTQPELPISLGWGLHVSYLIFPFSVIPPTMIYCGPVVWGVFCIHSWGRSLVVWSREARYAPHYDVWWWSVRVSR